MVDERATDWTVFALLLDPDDRLPWSTEEIARSAITPP
jgi:hypothetical protein